MAGLSVPKKIFLGAPVYADAQALTTPGAEQTLINVTVPPSTVRNLQALVVVCRMEGYFTVFAGAQLIGSGRTGAAVPNVPFSWTPARPIASGTIIQVKFKARLHSPQVSVEAFLQAADLAN